LKFSNRAILLPDIWIDSVVGEYRAGLGNIIRVFYPRFWKQSIHIVKCLPAPTSTSITQTPQPPAAGWVGTNYTYTPSHPHAVTALSGGAVASYQYDANGNTLAPGASVGVTCRVEMGLTYKQTYNPENRLSTVQKLASGDCATPLTYSASWSFSYDGNGTRVEQLYTTYDANGTEQSGVITSYFTLFRVLWAELMK